MKAIIDRCAMRAFAGVRWSAALVAVLLVAVAMPAARAEEGWQWSLTPYMWASGISEDLILDGSVVGGDDTPFDQLVDLIDTSVQLHFEGTRDRWGMFADVAYSELSDENVRQFLRTEAEITELTGEAGAIYRPGGRDGALDVLFGVRLFSVDEFYRFTLVDKLPLEVSSDDDHWDAMAGARYTFRFGDRWLVSMRGDLSMGGTDYIWTAQASGGWRFGSKRQSALLLGYRYRQLKYDKADLFKVERTMDGFIAGVRIGF